ncbi:MAG: hypothetical protein WKF37_09330 [Bryobacteraceae bacterium]
MKPRGRAKAGWPVQHALWKRINGIALFLAFSGAWPGTSNGLDQVKFESIEVAHIATDSLRSKLQLGGTAPLDLRLRAVALDDARINGIPVYLPPLTGDLRLIRGDTASANLSLEATALFPIRDFGAGAQTIRNRKSLRKQRPCACNQS